MIQIDGSSFQPSAFADKYPAGSPQAQLLDQLFASPAVYEYESADILAFELDLRSRILSAAEALANSALAFSGLAEARCNPMYWSCTDNGGFSLKQGVKPSDALMDIYQNGSLYATECASAVMIAYYRALLDVYGAKLFDKQFPDIYLHEWDIREPLLQELALADAETDILPGDRGYFANPDFDPSKPEYEGKNVIALSDSLFYGHGSGVTTADALTSQLNESRKQDMVLSAFLLSSAGRPDFSRLYYAHRTLTAQSAPLVWKAFPPPVAFA